MNEQNENITQSPEKKEEMKGVTFLLEKNLHRKLMVAAAKEGKRMAEYLREMITKEVKDLNI